MTRTIAGLLLGFVLMASGCSDKDSVPKDVLSHDKMEAVMWDVIQAEQYSANFLVKDTPRLDLKMENLRMYDEIFRLHQTSREQFRKSYQYYMGRADLAQVLFDSLVNKGNRLRSESYSRPARNLTAPLQPTKPPFIPGKAPGTTTPAGSTTPAGTPAPVAAPNKVTVPATTPAHGLTPAHALRDSLLKKRFPLLSPEQRDSLIRRRKLPS